MNAYFKFEDIAGKISRLLAGFCLMVVFVLFLLNISTRASFITWNPTWIDEVIQFFLVWMIFLAAAELVRTGEHFLVDIITDKLHGTLTGRICRLIATAIMLVTYIIILYFGIKLCIRSNIKMTFTLPHVVKMSWFYLCIPVATFFMVIYAIRDFIYAIADITTGGKITIKLDEMKALAKEHDEDAIAIEKAKQALKEQEKEN